MSETIPLQAHCAVCGRVRWGHYQVLGLGLWRHHECFAGSDNWLEAQRERPEAERSELFAYFAS